MCEELCEAFHLNFMKQREKATNWKFWVIPYKVGMMTTSQYWTFPSCDSYCYNRSHTGVSMWVCLFSSHLVKIAGTKLSLIPLVWLMLWDSTENLRLCYVRTRLYVCVLFVARTGWRRMSLEHVWWVSSTRHRSLAGTSPVLSARNSKSRCHSCFSLLFSVFVQARGVFISFKVILR